MLLIAGLAMGFVNNLAGAGGVLGLLAFDFAAGLDPSESNASLRLAAIAIGVAGAIGFRSHNQAIPKRAFRFGLWALPGGIAGALLAVRLPQIVYEVALLGTVTWLCIELVRSRRGHVAKPIENRFLQFLIFAGVGAYMGFLQVGTGLVAMAALSRTHSTDLVQVNTAKMAIVMLSSVAAVTTLALEGAIVWTPALWLAIGCGFGSFLASRFSVKKGQGTIRTVVLVVCVVTLVRTLYRLLT